VPSGNDAGEVSLRGGYPKVPTTGRLHHGGGVSFPVPPVRLPSQPSGQPDCGPPLPAAVIWQRHIFTAALSRAQTGAQRYHDAHQPRGLHFPAEQPPM